MDCPHCKKKMKCVDSRMYGAIRFRKYKCPECGFEEVTEERLPGRPEVCPARG